MRPEQLTLQARMERQARAMMVLSRRWPTYESDPQNATRAIIQSAAVALGVERASIWLFDAGGNALVCQDLYEASPHRHSRGFKLAERDCPAYFAALHSDDWIIAQDALQDPRTSAFAEGYLAPHGIGATLDLPIRAGGQVAGVLRSEHVGGPRVFQTDEQLTAAHLATLASLSCEYARRASAETQAAGAGSVMTAALNAAGVGVLVVDERGHVLHHNERLMQIWNLDTTMMGPAGDGGRRIEYIADQTVDPARFIARYRRISADLDQSSSDIVELKDGRSLVRSSAPQRVDGVVTGRAWSFRELDR